MMDRPTKRHKSSPNIAPTTARPGSDVVGGRAGRPRPAGPLGPGVVDAFYAGYETINPDDFNYLCKLDLDLRLPPRYFELLMQRMTETRASQPAAVRPMSRKRKPGAGASRRRHVARHDQVLSHALLQGDRWLCARSHVGRD